MKKQETNRKIVFASVLVAMFTTAIEGTIVATAMPSIVAELGGFSLFSWVFSAFLLTQVLTIPIYGKLADLYGRKLIFNVGMVIFLIGTVACGFAPTMKLLILFRLIQGIGAGAIQPIAVTIVGDIYSIQERGKVQGYISGVWGVSSIIGPALGGIFVMYLSWSWIFWINIPLGILAIAGIGIFLHENVEKKQHAIDYYGSVLLFIAISALMIVLIKVGVAWSWLSLPVFSLLAVFILGLILFVVQEKKASEPIMSLSIWKIKLIMFANLASLAAGAVMIGVSVFLPAYVQGVMERSPTVAGFTLSMMSIGWPISAAITGRLLLRFSSRSLAFIGGVLLVLGSIFLVSLNTGFGLIWAGIGAFLIGFGMGLANTTFIISIQNSVDWKNRGAATASNIFMRLLGNTIGAAVLWGVLNASMSGYLANFAGQLSLPAKLDITNVLLDPNKRNALSESTIKLLQSGLGLSIHKVFWGVLILSVISLAIISFLPKGKLVPQSGS